MSTNEYRCTRNQPYLNLNCFGYTDLESRQGYYIKAESEQDAIAQMAQLYPDDDAGFTAHLWKEISVPEEVIDCPRCEGTGFLFDDYTFQSFSCSSCAGTGIKDFAKRLPPASLREEPSGF